MSTSKSDDARRHETKTADESDTLPALDRVEDAEILTGRAEYIHDIAPQDSLTMVLVRCPHAHARIEDVETGDAEAHDACVGVMTAADVRARANPMPCPIEGYDEHLLAGEKARFAGEPVAAVVVDGDRYVAEDVADRVTVAYDRLDPVVTPDDARSDEVVIHETVGSNVAAAREFEFGAPAEAFEDADHVIEDTFSWGRISGVPLETAGVLARYDPGADTFRIESNIQLHTLVNQSVCETLGYPDEKVDLHVPAHVGGSFGTKIGAVTRYCCLAALASKDHERPVRYVEDRYENLQGGDAHSSDREYEVRLAVDDDGEFRALDVALVDDFGAYPRYAINQAVKPIAMATGTYDVDHVRYALEAILTNKTSQAPYRGFGVPPHNFVLEGIVDRAARVLDVDPTSLRRRNLLEADQLPYELPTHNIYDSGDYPAALGAVQEQLEAEREPGGLLAPETVAERRAAGKYRGVRPTVMVEPGVTQSDWRDLWDFDEAALGERTLADVSDIPEHLRAAVRPDGTVEALLATDSSGQGHQTIVVQLLADALDLPPEDIEVDYLGSAEAPTDYGSAASRMAVMLAGATAGLADVLEANLERLAADVWDCDQSQVTYTGGAVHHLDTGDELDLAELAAADRGRDADLATASYDYRHPALDLEKYGDALRGKLPSYATTAFAANAPIVEVDVETGEIEVLKFYSVRDCGTQLNPTIVEGQEQGGVAQGVGAALFEEFAFDSETGQPLAVTFYDYTPPSIDVVPEMEFTHTETPSPFTETGAKGVGETGITDAPAAIACSVNAALAPLDVVVDSIPMTAETVRRTVQDH